MSSCADFSPLRGVRMPEVLEVLEVCSKCAAAGRAAEPGVTSD